MADRGPVDAPWDSLPPADAVTEGAPDAPRADLPASDLRPPDVRAPDLRPLDLLQPDLKPVCSPPCGGAKPVCCDKGSGPQCHATSDTDGCLCNPAASVCAGTSFSICCNKGSGLRCYQSHYSITEGRCACDLASKAPCGGISGLLRQGLGAALLRHERHRRLHVRPGCLGLRRHELPGLLQHGSRQPLQPDLLPVRVHERGELRWQLCQVLQQGDGRSLLQRLPVSLRRAASRSGRARPARGSRPRRGRRGSGRGPRCGPRAPASAGAPPRRAAPG